MKKLVLLLILWCLITSSVVAEIAYEPDKVILSNRFIELECVGDYVIALSESGVTVLKWDYSVTSLEETAHLVLPSPAKSMKYTTLGPLIRHTNDDLSFVGTDFLDNVHLLGTVSPPVDFSDFAVVSENLYLSRWFDGIDEYRLENFNGLTFTGNDQSGVVITKLESSGDFLYGLDLYNGIVKYDLKNEFGESVSSWLLENRKTSFELLKYTVLLFGNEEGAIVGDFHGESVNILGEIREVQGLQRARAAGQIVVLMSERKVVIADLDSLSVVGSKILENVGWKGDVRTIDTSGRHLILPNLDAGISYFSIPEFVDSGQALERPGPITAVLILGNFLLTGGGENPLEVYEIESDSILPPIPISGEYKGLTDAAKIGNELFALFSNSGKVLKFDISDPTNCQVTEELDVSIPDAKQISVSDNLLLVVGKEQIEWFHEFNGRGIWSFEPLIVDVEMIQNSLYVTNVFGKVKAFSVQSDMTLMKCAERNLTGTGWAMSSYNNKLFVFTGNTLTVFSECLQLDTIVHLLSFVLDATIADDTLYTVGPNGIAKYVLQSGLPVFIDSGGMRGSQISANNGIIATTDGGSVHLYFKHSDSAVIKEEPDRLVSTTLFENYPNPFNSSTSINFEISATSTVELIIYNSLGQKIKHLANRMFFPGSYSINWDGRDEEGRSVASGVYFYRFIAGESTISKKMILLK